MQENFDQKYEWILDIEDERSISTGIVVGCGSDMNSTTPKYSSADFTFFSLHIFLLPSQIFASYCWWKLAHTFPCLFNWSMRAPEMFSAIGYVYCCNF